MYLAGITPWEVESSIEICSASLTHVTPRWPSAGEIDALIGSTRFDAACRRGGAAA